MTEINMKLMLTLQADQYPHAGVLEPMMELFPLSCATSVLPVREQYLTILSGFGRYPRWRFSGRRRMRSLYPLRKTLKHCCC